jgi:hypothetical protein
VALKEYNYDVIQGDSFVLYFELTDDQTIPQPIDLTGSQLHLEVKDKPGGKVLCATCSVGDGITITDLIHGKFTVNISPTKTRKFVFPKSAFQLQLIDAAGTATTLHKGWFNVDAGVIN